MEGLTGQQLLFVTMAFFVGCGISIILLSIAMFTGMIELKIVRKALRGDPAAQLFIMMAVILISGAFFVAILMSL